MSNVETHLQLDVGISLYFPDQVTTRATIPHRAILKYIKARERDLRLLIPITPSRADVPPSKTNNIPQNPSPLGIPSLSPHVRTCTLKAHTVHHQYVGLFSWFMQPHPHTHQPRSNPHIPYLIPHTLPKLRSLIVHPSQTRSTTPRDQMVISFHPAPALAPVGRAVSKSLKTDMMTGSDMTSDPPSVRSSLTPF